jgi:hypothetical protein
MHCPFGVVTQQLVLLFCYKLDTITLFTDSTDYMARTHNTMMVIQVESMQHNCVEYDLSGWWCAH